MYFILNHLHSFECTSYLSFCLYIEAVLYSVTNRSTPWMLPGFLCCLYVCILSVSSIMELLPAGKKKNNNLKLKTKLLCTGGHKCIFSYNVLCKFKNKLYKFSSNYILFISITMFCSYLYCSSVSSAQKLVICVYGFYSAVWCVDIWSWLFFRYLSASVISFYSLYNQACE